MKTKASVREVLGFDDTWMLIIGIPVVSFLMPLLFFKGTLAYGLPAYLPGWGVSLMYTIAYWIPIRSIFILMRRQFPDFSQIRLRIIATIALVTITFFVMSELVGLFHNHKKATVTNFDYNVASFTIVALVSVIYESVFLYDRWKKTIVEAEQLKRENIQSQLEGLKNQVNPHFLFNSLNTLAYIIPENADRAVQFVQKLSKVYRYILEIRDRQLISLAEELEFFQSYEFLVLERFGENLYIEVEIPEKLRKLQIVPLSLQMLLENAIKHNVISAEKPLTIKVSHDGDQFLTVFNNLQPKILETPSTKIGLQNIKNRYAFFSSSEVIVESTQTYFKVALPLLKGPQTAI